MTRREQRSLALLFGLAVVGHLARSLVIGPGKAPGALVLFDKNTDGDPRAQQALVRDLMRPMAAGERIDIEHAGTAELRRLPGVGPALAARIVADRESNGPFHNMAGLDRVPGIGVATQSRLAPYLQFSGVPADISKAANEGELVDLNQATVPELDALPGIGAARAKAIVAFRDSVGPFRQIEDLMRVPGLSKGVVTRIAELVVLR